jgi:hypothetical protein
MQLRGINFLPLGHASTPRQNQATGAPPGHVRVNRRSRPALTEMPNFRLHHISRKHGPFLGPRFQRTDWPKCCGTQSFSRLEPRRSLHIREGPPEVEMSRPQWKRPADSLWSDGRVQDARHVNVPHFSSCFCVVRSEMMGSDGLCWEARLSNSNLSDGVVQFTNRLLSFLGLPSTKLLRLLRAPVLV